VKSERTKLKKWKNYSQPVEGKKKIGKPAFYLLLQPDDPADTMCTVTLNGLLGKEPYSHSIDFDMRHDAMVTDSLPLHRLALKTEILDLEKCEWSIGVT